jgi:hypothetical protein
MPIYSQLLSNIYIEDYFERSFLKKVSLKLSPKIFDPELGGGASQWLLYGAGYVA